MEKVSRKPILNQVERYLRKYKKDSPTILNVASSSKDIIRSKRFKSTSLGLRDPSRLSPLAELETVYDAVYLTLGIEPFFSSQAAVMEYLAYLNSLVVPGGFLLGEYIEGSEIAYRFSKQPSFVLPSGVYTDFLPSTLSEVPFGASYTVTPSRQKAQTHYLVSASELQRQGEELGLKF